VPRENRPQLTAVPQIAVLVTGVSRIGVWRIGA
jgi:hypothetical protein